VTAAHVIVALQTIVSRRVEAIEPAVITVGSVHAGSKHNIIPSEAKLQLTVRSYTDKTRRVLLDGIREVTVNTCRAMGCTSDPDVVFRDDEYTPAVYNDPGLAAAAADVMRKAIGGEHVLVIPARMGGEDFGRYARHLEVPGFMFWLGTVNRQAFDAARASGVSLPSLHSSTYVADPEPSITTGVKCMSSIALSLLDSRD
jgi:metal-dependent amidase/aminoacylase/carboxypeptidase family protein